MPHYDPTVGPFEIFNEAMFMLLNYHLFTFSNGYLFDKMTMFKMGWSYLVCIGVLVLVNMVNIVIKAVKKAKRAKELKAMKKAHDLRMKQEAERRHQAMLQSDEYIIAMYEKKYGFDLINHEMGIYDKQESSSSEGSLLFEEERAKPKKNLKKDPKKGN